MLLSRRKWYISFITIGLLLIGYLLYAYFNAFQTVTFTFDSSEGSAELVDATGRTGITANTPIRLKKGSYYVAKKGENITRQAQEITIDSSTDTIAVTFWYSSDYLTKLLAQESSAIHNTLSQQYPKVLQLYAIQNETLYHRGDLYGAILMYKGKDRDNGDTLRVILRKEGDTWKVMSLPSPVLTTISLPTVPRDVIFDVNVKK